MKRHCNQIRLGNLICFPSGCFETATVLRIFFLSRSVSCNNMDEPLSSNEDTSTYINTHGHNFTSTKYKGNGTALPKATFTRLNDLCAHECFSTVSEIISVYTNMPKMQKSHYHSHTQGGGGWSGPIWTFDFLPE